MLSRALASVASPNSPGAGLFTVFNNPCTNPKISFSQLPALLSLSCEISDATNSDKQFAFRQCSLTTKLKYSCQMFLWQSKKNKISKFSYMEKSIYSENVIFWIFVAFMKLNQQHNCLIAIQIVFLKSTQRFSLTQFYNKRLSLENGSR